LRKVAVGPFHELSRYVSREFWWTFTHLRVQHGWELLESARLPANGDDLERVIGRPDVVLFWETYPQAARYGPELQRRGARLYVMTDDLHHPREGMERALSLADGVLSTYAPRLRAYWPRVEEARVHWVPHAACGDFLLPVEESPQPRVFVSGAAGRAYPLRGAMRDLARRRPDIAVVYDHPGYATSYDYERDPRVGRGFADAMRRHLAAFTDALVHHYIVAKHFEIPATGALLIADRAVRGQLEALGFVDGEHYLSAASHDLERVAAHAVHPHYREEVDAIRKRGHALVHARHTVEERAKAIEAICG
jgi:hypothetical protein